MKKTCKECQCDNNSQMLKIVNMKSKKYKGKQLFVIVVCILTHIVSFSQSNTISTKSDCLKNYETVYDYDGNAYNTVTIGDQIWLQENLKSLHYSDGTEITEVWSYDDNETYVPIYGRLYTWNGAMNYSTTEGSQGVCPDGWHLPTDAEWTELGTYLGGDNVAGGKLKSTGTDLWQAPNTGATNESGFTGLPAGEYDDSHYWLLGKNAIMWSSTETSTTWCKYRYLSYDDAGLHTYNYFKNFRYSVRCIKNSTVGLNELRGNEKKFQISPNPVSEKVLIQISEETNYPIDIYFYNTLGKLLKISSLLSNKFEIDVTDLPSDIYFVKCSINNSIYSEKLLIK